MWSVFVCLYTMTEQALGKQGMEHLNQELKTASRVDGLTGLFNRRYWQERFDEMYKLCVRRDKPSTAVMLDIDHFKRINDTYGHQAGDKVIKMLAALIKRCVRETDLAGRYGGEEFAIVLPETNEEGARDFATIVRELIEKAVFEFEGNIIPVTVSLGVAALQEKMVTPQDLIRLADERLYQAKRGGRNQVV